jgi:hypothetical protein
MHASRPSSTRSCWSTSLRNVRALVDQIEAEEGRRASAAPALRGIARVAVLLVVVVAVDGRASPGHPDDVPPRQPAAE